VPAKEATIRKLSAEGHDIDFEVLARNVGELQWHSSLLEFSGGQRALLWVAFVMSIAKFAQVRVVLKPSS
jgi:hypothetical protein